MDLELARALSDPPPQPHARRPPRGDHLDVTERPRRRAQGLGDGLLGAEARREVTRRPRPSLGVGPLAVGEQPLGEARTALECLLEPIDLE